VSRVVVLAVIALPAVLRAQETLTLDSAVAVAIRSATPVQQAQFATTSAGLNVLRQYGRFLPSLTAQTGGSIYNGNMLLSGTSTQAADTRYRTMGYTVGTSLDLFSVFTSYPALQAALENKSASELSLTRVRQSIALDVTQVYLQSVLDEQLVGIAKQNAAVSEQRVGQFAELVRVGKRPPADLYRVQAQASADESTLIDAENRQRADEVGLLERLHIDPTHGVRLAAPPADTTRLVGRDIDVAALIGLGLERRTDLHAANTEIHAARWSIRQAEREVLPSLDVGFGVFSADRVFDHYLLGGVNQLPATQNGLWSQLGNQTSTVFSVGVGYNFFNLFRSRVDAEQAQVQYRSARLTETDVRFAVSGDVARAIGDYGTAVQRLVTSGSGLTAAQAAYDAVSGRYDVGFAPLIDLLTAQAVLAQAQSIRAQAVIEFALRKRAVAYAIGLYPNDPLP
jgi:outer membrane protein